MCSATTALSPSPHSPKWPFIDPFPVKYLRGMSGEKLHNFELLFASFDRFTVLKDTALGIIDYQPRSNFTFTSLWRRSSLRRWAATRASSSALLKGFKI